APPISATTRKTSAGAGNDRRRRQRGGEAEAKSYEGRPAAGILLVEGARRFGPVAPSLYASGRVGQVNRSAHCRGPHMRPSSMLTGYPSDAEVRALHHDEIAVR